MGIEDHPLRPELGATMGVAIAARPGLELDEGRLRRDIDRFDARDLRRGVQDRPLDGVREGHRGRRTVEQLPTMASRTTSPSIASTVTSPPCEPR